MTDESLEKLKYPIGHFEKPDLIDQAQIEQWIGTLESLPSRLKNLTSELTTEQLETTYRPEGWTVRQLLHHISDSHHNSYVRFKWALTEDTPVIKAYDEKGWARLFDSQNAPIAISLDHLAAVHAKLVYLLKGLSPEQLKRTFIHPVGSLESTLEENIGKYAWHSNHHYAHIEGLLKRRGWM